MVGISLGKPVLDPLEFGEHKERCLTLPQESLDMKVCLELPLWKS